MSRTYAVIGTGGVGGFYGSQLARVGRSVKFLFRSDFTHVDKHGLKLESNLLGDFHLEKTKLKAYRDVKDMGKCDTVLVCLKTTSNHTLSQLLPPLLHDKSTVVLMQNGYGLEQDVAKQMSKLKADNKIPPTTGINIAGGLAFICSQKNSPGIISHIDYGKLTLGTYDSPKAHTHSEKHERRTQPHVTSDCAHAQTESKTPQHLHSSMAEPMSVDFSNRTRPRDSTKDVKDKTQNAETPTHSHSAHNHTSAGSITDQNAEPTETQNIAPASIAHEAIRVLALDLRESGVDVAIAEDLLTARWHKLMWNIPFSGLSVLMDAQTDVIVGDKESRARVEALIREVIKAAKAIDDIDIPDSLLHDMIEKTKVMAKYAPSMKLDFDAQRPMEIEAIYANLLREAQTAGCRLPEIMRVFEGLYALESRQMAQGE